VTARSTHRRLPANILLCGSNAARRGAGCRARRKRLRCACPCSGWRWRAGPAPAQDLVRPAGVRSCCAAGAGDLPEWGRAS